jgi:ABC-type glycerol-3-phosphate transport system permease component
MPLVAKVGRRSARVRLLFALLYLLLGLGGVTMVYPFLITVTAAMSNAYDYWHFSPYPAYWFDPGHRYLKYLAEKYGAPGRFDLFRAAYRTPEHWGEFRHVAFETNVLRHFPVFGAERRPGGRERLERIARDYEAFVTQVSSTRRGAERLAPLFLSYNLPAYRRFLRERYERLALDRRDATRPPGGRLTGAALEQEALALMTRVRGDACEDFFAITLADAANYPYELRRWMPRPSAAHLDFADWVTALPPSHKLPVTRHYLWTRFLIEEGWDAADWQAATGENVASILAARYPGGTNLPPRLAEAREAFLRSSWPLRLTRLRGDPRPGFIAFLRARHPTLAAFNRLAGTRFTDWNEVPCPLEAPAAPDGIPAHEANPAPAAFLAALWRDYAESLPADRREDVAPEDEYRVFLLARHGSLEAVNRAYGWNHASADDIDLPVPEADYVHFLENSGAFFWKFVTFNTSQVVEYMATKGRAFLNTLLLVALTVLATLTINPLAAYALSRFQMRATNKILIFLLATMAFPAEVAMIPSFLLLRDLGLLNTFGALILPGLANGFSIFLLKGFFDSLPRELYEAAAIDGAREMRIFTTITLPLSRPILAVTALDAFIGAYSGFMWAFLSCQDPKMWTVMVWLYQFQQNMAGSPYMVMAALLLASLPTLLVFLFCQKIILRGIIIPSMK